MVAESGEQRARDTAALVQEEQVLPLQYCSSTLLYDPMLSATRENWIVLRCPVVLSWTVVLGWCVVLRS